jgi:hypothetical protein
MPDFWMDVDTALGEVPVNIMPLLDDTDFKSRETTVAFDAAGMDLVWNFVTSAGAFTQTAVTPTSGGTYDWTHQGDGMYTIEIPASGGASINNDTEGFGWFTGVATGVLPWRGPTIGLRASGLNDKLIDSTYSTTRGLAGTALPDAAAEAAGGLYTRGTGAGQINQNGDGQVDTRTVAMASNVVTAAALATDAGAEIADAVWDEALAGHQTAGTAGRNLTIAASILGEFTLTGTPTSTVLRISGGSAVNDYYNDLQLLITSGALVGQARPISDYDGGTGDITVDEAFTSAPASGVTVAILASHAHPVTQIQSGLATAAGVAAVETDTQDIQSRLPAALVSGNMPASIEAVNGTAIQGDGSSGNKWRPA